MQTIKRLVSCAALVWLCCGSIANAQTLEYHLYFDVDLNASGCQIMLPNTGETLAGIDRKLTARIDVNTAQVTSLTVASCAGIGFGAETTLASNYPVATNSGTAGADAIEMSAPLSSVTQEGFSPRVFAVAENLDTGSEDLIATRNGLPDGPSISLFIGSGIPIPSLSLLGIALLITVLIVFAIPVLKRHLLLTTISLLLVYGTAFAMTLIFDGDVSDWGGSPTASDPSGDSTPAEEGTDLLALFLAVQGNDMFARLDVGDLENAAPEANADSVTTPEDIPLTITLTGSDLNGDPLTFAIATGPVNGTLGPVTPVDATSATVEYTPNMDYNGMDSFTFTVNDGLATSAEATVDIEVGDVNDLPVADPQSVTTNEDTALAITLTGSDPESDPLTFTIDVAPVNGMLSGAAPDLTYTPNADFSGSDSFTFFVNDGMDNSPSVTVDITVNEVNDQPSFTPGADPTVLEDDAAQTIAGWATAIDPGSAPEAGQSLIFNVINNTNTGLFAAGPSIDPTSGDLSFTPVADANGSADITVELMDDGGTADGGIDTSASVTFTINVTAVNDAPSFTAGGDVNLLEDPGMQDIAGWATAISPGPADESGQNLIFNVIGNTNPALFDVAPSISPAGDLSFTPAASTTGVAVITVELMDDGGTANGGADTSASVMFTISITEVNDAPSFTPGPDQTVAEDAGAQNVAGWATAISPGPADESGQSVTFNVTGNTNPGMFAAGPSISSTGDLSYTPADNANGSADITIELMDDGGTANGGVDTSPPATFTITITSVNDPPVLAPIGAQSVDELVELSFTATATDPNDTPANNLTFSLAGEPAGAAITGGGMFTWTPTEAQGPGVYMFDVVVTDDGTPNESASETITVTVNEINLPPVLDAIGDQSGDEDTLISFTATANDTDLPLQTLTFSLSGEPTGATITGGLFEWTPTEMQGPGMYTFDVIVDDGNGGMDSETITVTVNEVNVPPVATDDTYDATGNVGIDVDAASGLLANDSDADLPAQVLTATAETVASANGGSAAIAADGSFTYTPPAGFTGMDTFSYTLNDNEPSGNLTDTGTVTITVANMIWFIDSAAAGPGTGTLADPFNTLTGFNGSASAPGHCIFIDEGTYTDAPINLQDNQRLIGEASAGSIDAECGITLASFSNTLPTTTNDASSRPTLQAGGTDNIVVLAANNKLTGFDTNKTTTVGTAIQATNAAGNLEVSLVSVLGGGPAVNMATSANFGSLVNFDTVQCNTSAQACINLLNVTGTMNVAAGGTGLTSSSSSAPLMNILGGTVSLTYPGNLNQSANQPTINVSNHNTGTINIGGTVNATSGTGLQFNGANGSYNLMGTMTLNGGDAGVDILTGSMGTFNFTGAGSSITSPSGVAFRVNSSAANVTYSGTITQANANAAVSVIGNTGTVTLSGFIDADTSTLTAIDLDNHGVVNITGGMDIDTTSGAGFTAVNGGQINVSGTNTVNTTTGTAVNITTSTIGTGVTFQSVSVNGATNGIVLNNSGTGPFMVTGTGTTDNTGGTLQSTTGDAVSLTNANNVILANMRIASAGGDGISSSGGSNHVVSGTDITTPARAGWEIVNLQGNNRLDSDSQIDNVHTSGFGFIDWTNTSINGNLTINDSILRDQAGTNGNSVVDVTAAGTSVMSLTIENNSEFRALFGNSINAAAGLNIGDTAVLNTTVNNSFIEDAVAAGIQTLFAGAVGGATNNMSMSGNTHQDLATGLALTAGIVQIQSFDSGVLTGTIAAKDIDNIGRRGIQIAPENTTGTNSSVTFNNHAIDNTAQEALFVSTRTNSNLDVTVTNSVAGSVSPVATLGREGFELLSEDSSHLDMLVDNNTITNQPNGSTDEVIDIDAENSSTFHATVTNNTKTSTGTDPTGEFEAEVDASTATLCLDLRGNTVATTVGGGSATFELDDDDGNVNNNFTVENLAGVAGANTGTVNVNDASIANAASCPEVGH